MPRHQASHTLDATLLRQLDHLAEEHDLSRSELVNQLLQEALARREKVQIIEAAATAGVGTASLVALIHMAQLLTLVL